MIGRVSELREFERLNRHGRRARTDTLWCRYLDEPGAAALRVAFAIGRPVGTAVTRNRLRRRLRELVRAAVAVDEVAVAPGMLLIGARPAAAELPFDGLRREVDGLLAALRRAGAGPS